MTHLLKNIEILLLVAVISSNAMLAQNLQPEVSSFEEFNTNDMVNYQTGDFVYNMPILYVPSPNGGYNLNLMYHGGIKNGQQSSWVGLGWNINPGSISRIVSGYPDDYNGNTVEYILQSDGGKAFLKSFLFYTHNYNSNKGHNHNVNMFGFDFSWGDYGFGSSFMGFSTYDDDPFWEPTETLFDIGSILASGGLGASPSTSLLEAIGDEIKGKVKSGLVQTAMTMPQSNNRPNAPHLWTYKNTDINFLNIYRHSEQESFLNANIFNNVYGPIYAHNIQYDFQLNNTNTCDMNYPDYPETTDKSSNTNDLSVISADFTDNGTGVGLSVFQFLFGDNTQNIHDSHMYYESGKYLESLQPAKLNYDFFNVYGEGVSGAIQPYRTEIGSVCQNKFGEAKIKSGAIERYYIYKPGFRYLNSLNYYTHHAGYNLSDDEMGITRSWDSNRRMYFHILDPYITCYPFEDEELREDGGLFNKRLIGGKHVEWYSNDEILNGIAKDQGFIDYIPPHAANKTEFREECDRNYFTSVSGISVIIDESEYRGDGIGGFMVTASNGVTYHYALPVYTNKEYSKTISGPNDDPIYSTSINENKYASNWLLTAITGPGYIDNGDEGLDPEDWGYWVKFEYSRHMQNNVTRVPWVDDNAYMPGKENIPFVNNRAEYSYFSDPGNNSKTYTYTSNEIYYLDYIKTSTHTAVFKKSPKAGRDRLLRLNEISIFKNEDINITNKPQFIDYLSGKAVGINSDIERYEDNYLKKIEFVSDYYLAPYPDQTEGLLTLKQINTVFPGGELIYPPYLFGYTNNQTFNYLNTDGWGMFSYDLDIYPSRNVNAGGYEWSLNYINTPVGTKVGISYERDTYSSVMGHDLSGFCLYPEFNKEDNSCMFTFERTSSGICEIRYHGDYQAFVIPEIKNGDQIRIRNLKYKRIYNKDEGTDQRYSETFIDVDGVYNIIDHGLKRVTIDFPLHVGDNEDEKYLSREILSFDAISNTRGLEESLGGDVRVSQLEVGTFGNLQKTRFIYTQNSNPVGPTSGYCFSEPPFCRSNIDYYFSDAFKFGTPTSSIKYSKVTVLDNYISETEFNTKTVYNYQAPQTTDYELSNYDVYTDTYHSEPKYLNYMRQFVLHDKTSRIGRLNSTKKYNSYNKLISNVEYSYIEDSKYGKITHGTIVNDYHNGNGDTYNGYEVNRLIRTTIIEYPNLLSSITSIGNNNSLTQNFNEEDIDVLSDQYLAEEKVNNVTGEVFRTEIIPAYKVYDDMGPKGLESSYKNMLTQTAATISKKDGSVIGASINTWNDDWDYYTWDGTRLNKDGSDPGSLWRKHKTFVWNGVLNDNGNYGSDFDAYNTTSNLVSNWSDIESNPLWLKNSEVTTYDHYSTPIEVTDINGDYAATKKDPEDNRTVATAANASYSQFVHCTFEHNWPNDGKNGRGEGGAYINAIEFTGQMQSHSGERGLLLAESGTVHYTVPATEVAKWNFPITFHSSVWVYDAGNVNSCKITTNISGALTEDLDWFQTGEWVQIRKKITINSNPGTDVEFSVDNEGHHMFIDDFRIAPKGSAVTAYTYDYAGNVTSILNTDNFATTYTYDAAGRLIETHVEKPSGFEKVAENDYHYERLFITPDFTISPENPKYGDEVKFTVTNTFEGYSYSWNFGDNTTLDPSTSNNIVTHTYQSSSRTSMDSYNIWLTVTDLYKKEGKAKRTIHIPYIYFYNDYSGKDCWIESTNNPFSLITSGACFDLRAEWDAGGTPVEFVNIEDCGPLYANNDFQSAWNTRPFDFQSYDLNESDNTKYKLWVYEENSKIILESPALYYFETKKITADDGRYAQCEDNVVVYYSPAINIPHQMNWLYGSTIQYEYSNIPENFYIELVKYGDDEIIGGTGFNQGDHMGGYVAGNGTIDWTVNFNTSEVNFEKDILQLVFYPLDGGETRLAESDAIKIVNPSIGFSLTTEELLGIVTGDITLSGIHSPDDPNRPSGWILRDNSMQEITKRSGRDFEYPFNTPGTYSLYYYVDITLYMYSDGGMSTHRVHGTKTIVIPEPELSVSLPDKMIRGYEVTGTINLENVQDPYESDKTYSWTISHPIGYSSSGNTRNISFTPPYTGSDPTMRYTLTYSVESELLSTPITETIYPNIVYPTMRLVTGIPPNITPRTGRIVFDCNGKPDSFHAMVESDVPYEIIEVPSTRTKDFYTFNTNLFTGSSGYSGFNISVNNDPTLGTNYPCCDRYNYFELRETGGIASSKASSPLYWVYQDHTTGECDGYDCTQATHCDNSSSSGGSSSGGTLYSGPVVTSPRSGLTYDECETMTIEWEGGTGDVVFVLYHDAIDFEKEITQFVNAETNTSTTWEIDISELHDIDSYDPFGFKIGAKIIGVEHEESKSGLFRINEVEVCPAK